MNEDEAHAERLQTLRGKAEAFTVELRTLCGEYGLRLLIQSEGAADLYVSDESGFVELKLLTEQPSSHDDDYWGPRTFPRMTKP